MRFFLFFLFLSANSLASDFDKNVGLSYMDEKFPDGTFRHLNIGIVDIKFNDNFFLASSGNDVITFQTCRANCEMYFVTTPEPFLSVHDSSVITEGNGVSREGGQWFESWGIHPLDRFEKVPVFNVPELSSKRCYNNDIRYIGLLTNHFGNRWGGATLNLINVDCGYQFERDIQIGQNTWVRNWLRN